MKVLIVFYIPTDIIPNSRKARKRMTKSFKKKRPEGSEIIIIEDPTVQFIHTEVFFKPE